MRSLDLECDRDDHNEKFQDVSLSTATLSGNCCLQDFPRFISRVNNRIKLRRREFKEERTEVKVATSWMRHAHSVPAEASTDDSVVGRVARNCAHPSEYPPTSYYRRNNVLAGETLICHVTCATARKGVHENLARFIAALSYLRIPACSAREAKTTHSYSAASSLYASSTTDFPIVIGASRVHDNDILQSG